MKKLLIILAAAVCLSVSVSAEESSSSTPIWNHGDNVSKITYQNVQVMRILNGRDAYVVLYARPGIKMGKCVIPKSWAKATKDSPRKLVFRKKPAGLDSYMTVIKEDGEFKKVWLTLPPNKIDSIWGHIPAGVKIEGTDAETLEIQK